MKYSTLVLALFLNTIEAHKGYEEVYKSFASYYDKENPITQKKG